jgi:hydrogenase maturation factor
MEIGKFPPELLERLLDSIGLDDPRVVLGPRVGEDAAVLDFGDRLLVAKTDPVTFASERAGWYAVQVCANDVACTGATPLWFMATLLAPEWCTPDDAAQMFKDVLAACRELGVTLIGGHSEVTQGISRPIVMGTMLGEVDRDRLITTGGAQEGDSIVVTKGLAIEGTAILGQDKGQDLRRAGVHERVIKDSAALLHSPGISVVPEARIASTQMLVHSMHDATEGGLITALHEVAAASGLGLAIEEDSVPVLPETAEACTALGLDPLGLLASGALVMTLPAAQVPRLLHSLEQAGINAWEIGQMLPVEEGRILFTRSGEEITLPVFQRDELARYFSQE